MLNYQPRYLGVTKQVILFQFSSKIPLLQRRLWDPGEGGQGAKKWAGGAESERGTEEVGDATEAVRCHQVSPGPGLRRPRVLSNIFHLLTFGPWGHVMKMTRTSVFPPAKRSNIHFTVVMRLNDQWLWESWLICAHWSDDIDYHTSAKSGTHTWEPWSKANVCSLQPSDIKNATKCCQ